jgi:hypothetical protein
LNAATQTREKKKKTDKINARRFKKIAKSQQPQNEKK